MLRAALRRRGCRQGTAAGDAAGGVGSARGLLKGGLSGAAHFGLAARILRSAASASGWDGKGGGWLQRNAAAAAVGRSARDGVDGGRRTGCRTMCSRAARARHSRMWIAGGGRAVVPYGVACAQAHRWMGRPGGRAAAGGDASGGQLRHADASGGGLNFYGAKASLKYRIEKQGSLACAGSGDRWSGRHATMLPCRVESYAAAPAPLRRLPTHSVLHAAWGWPA